MADPRLIDVIANVAGPIRQNVAPGDRVVVLADTQTEPTVWEAFAAAVKIAGGKATVVVAEPLPYHQANVDEAVAGALERAKLVITCGTVPMSHSEIVHELMKKGVGFFVSENVTVKMLSSGGATADYDEIQRLGERIVRMWAAGKRVRITSDNGTDITASIDGRFGYIGAAKVLRQQGVDLLLGSIPSGEVAVAPVEGTAEGTIVIDLAAHHVGIVREPITWRFRQGRVVQMSGGESRIIEEYLQRNGDENSTELGEIALGLNPKTQVQGVMREDKNLYGSAHFGIGMNTNIGGRTASKSHLDGIVRKVSCWIDDTLVVDDGRIVV